MRHFGDSAQPYSTSADPADSFAGRLDKPANLAKFIHDQFSPANQYDLARPAQPATDSSLPSVSFHPEQSNRIAAKPLESSLNILINQQFSFNDRAPEKLQSKVSEDFRSPLKQDIRVEAGINSRAARDAAFNADNCYQTLSINPQDGSRKTVTTLSDLSSSRIETKAATGSSVIYTDRLGRPVSESNFDQSGKLISETTAQFENSSSAIPTRKTIKTADQTIEISLDSKGMITGKNILPYSDLNQA